MDPLGAVPDITAPSDILRWGQDSTANDPLSQASEAAATLGADLPCVHKTPPFNIRPDLNEKVAFW